MKAGKIKKGNRSCVYRLPLVKKIHKRTLSISNILMANFALSLTICYLWCWHWYGQFAQKNTVLVAQLDSPLKCLRKFENFLTTKIAGNIGIFEMGKYNFCGIRKVNNFCLKLKAAETSYSAWSLQLWSPGVWDIHQPSESPLSKHWPRLRHMSLQDFTQ